MNKNGPSVEDFKAYMLSMYPEFMKPYVAGRIGPDNNLLINWVQFHTDMIQKYDMVQYVGADHASEGIDDWCSFDKLATWIYFHPNEFEMVIL